MNTEINLIKISGKSLKKFIEVVSGGLGVLYQPRAIRKEADAEAYRREKLAIADARKRLIENQADTALAERAGARLHSQELLRQSNIEDIVEKAIPHLGESVADEEVDLDWRSRFFQKAQDVSNDDMQEIWAKILATEVSNPGKVSFRTLEVISNISKDEAEIFTRACSLASACKWVWKIGNSDSFGSYSVSYDDLMVLREAGLVHVGDSLGVTFKLEELNGELSIILDVGEKLYKVESKGDDVIEKLDMQLVAFTKSGSEICYVLDKNFNEKYFSDLLSSLSNEYILNEMAME